MKKIPMVKTEEEEIKFWETHSIADYIVKMSPSPLLQDYRLIF